MGLEVTIQDNSAAVKHAKDLQMWAALEMVGMHLEGEAADELENDPKRVDTGRLKGSISHKVKIGEEAVYVGTNVEYAIYVHEGTRRMDPNPFLKNAFDRNLEQCKQYIIDALEGD